MQTNKANDPYEVVLEFSRKERAEDPYGFQPAKPVKKEYRVRAGNGRQHTAVFPWDEQLASDMAVLRQPHPDPEVARRLGERMSRFLDELDWGGHEQAVARARDAGRPLRVVIRSAAAELYSLPWELVTQKGSGQHLVDGPACSLSYEWPQDTGEGPRASAQLGGRVVLAWSAAGGDVPAPEHVQALQRACHAGDIAFHVQRDVLHRVSLSRLAQLLKDPSQEPVSVLHVLCHGTSVGTQESGVMGLEWDGPEEGSTARVDGGMLAAILAPHAATLRMVVLCACSSGDGGRVVSYLGGVAQALSRVGIEAVVASRLPLSARGSMLLTETLYEKLLVQSCSLDEALAASRVRLREEGDGYDWASLQLYAHREEGVDLRPVVLRPYRGLLHFERRHQHFFFGREKVKAELLARVREAVSGERPRFQVVAGASGTGKSSVILAGLMPQLDPKEWDCLVVRPGELRQAGQHGSQDRLSVLQALGQRLSQLRTREKKRASADPRCEPVEEARPLTAVLGGRKLLLVVDQLEEVFTQLEQEERQDFLRGVWALTQQPELKCVVVASMRVDYFARCGEVALDEETRLDGVVYSEAYRMFVAHMSAEELTAVIVEPARRVGLMLEEGLVERLRQCVDKEPGALPLLEHALDLLWQRRQGRWLTHQAYWQIGEVAGALSQTADQLCLGLSQGERQQARRLLVKLATAQGLAVSRAKGRVWVEEAQPQDEEGRRLFAKALEKLVQGRLLVMGSTGDKPAEAGRQWVQLAHDALLHRWKLLQRWRDEDWEREKHLRELESWAVAWEEHRQSEDQGASFLLVGDRLAYVKSLSARYGGELTPRSQSLLEASLAAEARGKAEEQLRQEKEKQTMLALAEAQARAARFFRGGFVVAVLLLLVALAAVIMITRTLKREKELREVAESTLQLLLTDARLGQPPGLARTSGYAESLLGLDSESAEPRPSSSRTRFTKARILAG